MTSPEEIARRYGIAVRYIAKRPIRVEDYKTELPIAHRYAKRGYEAPRGFRNATPDDVEELVTENTLIVDAASGRAAIVYLRIPEDTAELVAALQTIDFYSGYRADGSPTGASVIAGTRVSNHGRAVDYCSTAALARHNPRAHDAIIDYALIASRYYADLNPELYAEHLAMADSLPHQEWRVPGSPLTSGIVNKDNVLPYHFDAGNVPDGWSMMLGFKRDIEEGYLVIPEYGIALEVADNSLSGFDGQVSLHGVSPFRKTSRYAYRYTIVFYAKAGAWRCLSREDEVREGARVRTLKEQRRAGLVPAPSSMTGGVQSEKGPK